MNSDTQPLDPGPRAATLLGLAIGIILGFLAGFIGLDWASFEFGKWVGATTTEREVEMAMLESGIFQELGCRSLEECLRVIQSIPRSSSFQINIDDDFLKILADRKAELR